MLCAHMYGYLDLSKEIPPLLESLIFRQLEIKLNIETSSIYPVLDAKEHLYYINKESFEEFKKMQTPWVYKKQEKESKMSMADKIALLNKLNNQE